MNFTGQEAIMNQLKIYLPYLYSNPVGENFMVTAPSGYGKTRLCLLCCNYLSPAGRFQYAEPKEGVLTFDEGVRIHFFDEVHNLREPEFLYRIMDRKEHVIFLATNESGNLKEPLVNRCIPLIFSEYSTDALIKICRESFHYNVPDNFLLSVIKAGANNPRVILYLLQRLNMVIKQHGIPDDVESVLESIFGIKDGLDMAAQRYLKALKELGGRASLETLSAYLHMNKATLLYQVEPVLLYGRRIQITSKGRILHDNVE